MALPRVPDRAGLRRIALRLAGGLPLPSRRPGSEFGRIALIRPDHLGDLVLAQPAIDRLRDALPDATVDLWVGPWSAPVAAGIGGVAVRTLPFPGFERTPKRSPLAPYEVLSAAARRLRSDRYDAAIILRFDHWWGALLAKLSGIPVRIGYDQPDTSPLLTHRLPHRPGHHETLQNATLVDCLVNLAGVQPTTDPPGRPSLSFPGEVTPNGLPEHFAIFHPGAGAPVKRWRPERFGEVARALEERYGLAIAVSGSEAERPLVDQTIAALPGGAVPLVGLGLPILAAALRRARLVLGPDSGILHLASAVGTPTVRLYGPVDHATFGPWSDPDSRVVVSPMLCVPCNRLDWPQELLPYHPCVREIATERVLTAIDSLLGSR
ncbi:MAG: glycosyltransferase family 9 protein [Dehalococcoidia bacterium]